MGSIHGSSPFTHNTFQRGGIFHRILRLKKREGDYDSIYLSHGPRVVEKALVDSVIAVCDDILAGKSDEAPFQGSSRLRMAVMPRV